MDTKLKLDILELMFSSEKNLKAKVKAIIDELMLDNELRIKRGYSKAELNRIYRAVFGRDHFRIENKKRKKVKV